MVIGTLSETREGWRKEVNAGCWEKRGETMSGLLEAWRKDVEVWTGPCSTEVTPLE